MKRMPVKEFRDIGLLQEVNRQFFHPLGLAIEVVVDNETGEERFGGVWDCRDDPEGFVFAEIDVEKAQQVITEQVRRSLLRQQALGFVVQPIEGAANASG